ncbi:MAG: hypothetical protein WBZ33_11220 [Thermoactinomyces sp.]
MVTLFIEYRIAPDKWEKYLTMIPAIRSQVTQAGEIALHQFLTSDEQNGLIVELIQSADPEKLEEIRQLYTNESGDILLQLRSCLAAGKSKVNAWRFKSLATSGDEC